MDEYIKREAALALVKPDAPEDEKAAVTIGTAKKLIRNIVRRTPAADVAPVVHGRWIDPEDDDGGTLWHCSKCGCPVKTISKPNCNYCPKCGARMDGGEEDAAH